MVRVGLIGFGHWGQIIYQKLLKICYVDFICRRSDNYLTKIDKVDWVIIATPNETHYQIVLDCLNFGKHVFCEKPLTLTKAESIKLYQLAERNKVKLYVSDVQNYINIDYNFLQHNLVERRKKSKNSDYKIKDLLYRLTYHDIYFLYQHIHELTIKDILLLDLQNKLRFKIIFHNNVDIDFLYDVEYNNGTKHYINGTNLRKELEFDPLYQMLKCVLSGQANLQYNKKITLFTNTIIDKLSEQM